MSNCPLFVRFLSKQTLTGIGSIYIWTIGHYNYYKVIYIVIVIVAALYNSPYNNCIACI